MMKLYGYYRSSAAYRVRIALQIKGLEWQSVPVNLLTGEQKDQTYGQINSQGLVPTLAAEDKLLIQSLAIIEWLDDEFPQVALLPKDFIDKAQVRALAYQVAMEIHPLNNLRVVKYLKNDLALDESQKMQWYRHWIAQGFTALELSLQQVNCQGQFCFGSSPTLADVCLIPQVYNALRFECEMGDYPLIHRVWQHCNSLMAFKEAAPEAQADCPQAD